LLTAFCEGVKEKSAGARVISEAKSTLINFIKEHLYITATYKLANSSI
jgi:hypothetical protein